VANEKLVNLVGLEKLARVGTGAELGEELFIGFNPVLTSLTGLSGLVNLDATLAINDNDILQNMAGLERLERIGGWLEIERDPSLKSLSGLEHLTRAQLVYIGECPRLTSLRALAAMTVIDLGIAIRSNTSLPTCEAQWFRDHVAMLSGDVDIEGTDDAAVCR